jgi:hypothetical protein
MAILGVRVVLVYAVHIQVILRQEEVIVEIIISTIKIPLTASLDSEVKTNTFFEIKIESILFVFFSL